MSQEKKPGFGMWVRIYGIKLEGCEGQGLIESVFVVPILLLLSLVTVDGSRMMYVHNTMLQAARQAASDAARRPEFRSDYVVQEGTTLQQAQEAAIQNIKDLTLNYLNSGLNPNLAPEIEISVPGVGNALNALENPIQVTIKTTNFDLMTGALLPPAMNKKPTITARGGSFIEQSKVAVPTKNYVENVPDLDGDGIENSIDTNPSTNCVNQGQGACCLQAADICAEQCAEVTDFASCTDRCRIMLEALCTPTDQCLVLEIVEQCTDFQLCYNLRRDEHCTPDQLCLRDYPADHNTPNCNDEQKCRFRYDVLNSCPGTTICSFVDWYNKETYCPYCTDMCTKTYCNQLPACQCTLENQTYCTDSQRCYTLRQDQYCTADQLCIRDYQTNPNTPNCTQEQKCRFRFDVLNSCPANTICSLVDWYNKETYCPYCTDMCTKTYCNQLPACQCTLENQQYCTDSQRCYTLRQDQYCTADQRCIRDYQTNPNTPNCTQEQKCRFRYDVLNSCPANTICSLVDWYNKETYCPYCTDMCTKTYCNQLPACQCSLEHMENCSSDQQCRLDISRCTNESQTCKFHIDSCSDQWLCVYHPNDPRCTISS